jgi:hypothetical protein
MAAPQRAVLPAPARAGDGMSFRRTNCGNRTHQHHRAMMPTTPVSGCCQAGLGCGWRVDFALTTGPGRGAYLIHQ